MKIIFITITRGLIARNILRTRVLNDLSNHKKIRLVILILNAKNTKKIPLYLIKEIKERFNGAIIEFVPNKSLGIIEKIFYSFFASKLVFSRSTEIYLRFGAHENKRKGVLLFWIYKIIFSGLSKLQFFKKIIRKIDLYLPIPKLYKKYFDKYGPCLVFSTSIVSVFDILFLKEAKRRGIKTISMPKSWDNLGKLFFRVAPDLFLVQNEVMKRKTPTYQVLDAEKIKVVGFPQFDIYENNNVLWTRNLYCQKKSFNPKLPILFLGSEGVWSTGDEKIFKSIYDARESGRIPDCNLLIRPHFIAVKNHPYNNFRNLRNVFIDDGYRQSNFFIDGWDPTQNDMVDFTNSLFHCNVMIAFASTLALDAVCFDKPFIAIRYGVRFQNGKDITSVTYESDFYGWVLKHSAISLVDDEDSLIKQINQYLLNKQIKKKERAQLKEQLCYKIDGNSAQRISESIFKNL